MRLAGHGAFIALAFVALAACAGGGAGERPTATVALTQAPSPSPSDISPTGDPALTVEHAIQACREKNGELLRSFVAVAVRAEEIQALFDRGADVRLEIQTVPRVEDGRATVDVRLEVTRAGEIETVDRAWELVRGADGFWRFTALPDCF